MKHLAPSLWKNDAAGGTCASLPPNLRAECEKNALKSSTEARPNPFLSLLGIGFLFVLLAASVPLAVSLFEKSKK